ncbi:MAG TPA: ATP-binding protein [Anaeromyxobacteraceae bacterium]|nr:ATP-binding protein [Anaeromyxobacteraceae bacterium]
MTLRLKLFVLVAGVVVFATSGVTAVALWREVVRGQELLAREGSAIAASAAQAASRWLGPQGADPGGTEALQDIMGRLLESGPFDRCWVVDRAGALVACASRLGEACPERTPPSVFQGPQSPLEALDRLVHPEGIVASAPVLREGMLVGAVQVDYQHEEVVGSARRLGWGVALIAGFWIAMGHLLAVVLLRHITRPLEQVIAAADTLAEEGGVQLPIPQDRELAELVRAVNRMSRRLGERREENTRLIDSLEQRVAQKTREVLRADRLATLGGIAAGFAHELGNSLNVMRGYTAVVLRELPADHPNRADLEAIKREVGRAAGLIERFLVFARARTVHPTVQPVEPVLREAVEVVGPAAAQAGVRTEVQVDAPVPEIRADAEMLRQAFLNLCVNAVQAMQPDGGRLSVHLQREGSGVRVDFSDTGPGMDAEVQAHVFEPFYTTKANGTGLGLAIVRQAAEAHGGSVEVESRPGAGSTFRIRLPGAEEASA